MLIEAFSNADSSEVEAKETREQQPPYRDQVARPAAHLVHFGAPVVTSTASVAWREQTMKCLPTGRS